jgi:hypothetical protein
MPKLPRPPRQTGIWETDRREIFKWFDSIWLLLGRTAQIAWDMVSKTGSNLSDLETRNHSDLQNRDATQAHPSKAIKYPVSTKDAAYTMTEDDFLILCDGTFDVTLMAAATISGLLVDVKNVGSGTITILPCGVETIDGEVSTELFPFESMTFQSDGTNWVII